MSDKPVEKPIQRVQHSNMAKDSAAHLTTRPGAVNPFLPKQNAAVQVPTQTAVVPEKKG